MTSRSSSRGECHLNQAMEPRSKSQYSIGGASESEDFVIVKHHDDSGRRHPPLRTRRRTSLAVHARKIQSSSESIWLLPFRLILKLSNIIFQRPEIHFNKIRSRIRCKKEIEQLIAELRFMEHDHMLVDFLARQRKREPDRWYLHDYLRECQEIPKNYDAGAKYPCGLDTLPPFGQVSWPIVDYLSKVGLYGPIFTYFSRFPGPPRGEMARVFEELQYQFDNRMPLPGLCFFIEAHRELQFQLK